MTRQEHTPHLVSPLSTLRRLAAVAGAFALALTIVWFAGGADTPGTSGHAPGAQSSPHFASTGKPAG
ncbi:MAG: hypothetical protein JSW10_01500 [Pseudomonadota bacterium]|nr:MAG: hypothetical protein JSW10_01500 [Pseudomonadota bacterium]